MAAQQLWDLTNEDLFGAATDDNIMMAADDVTDYFKKIEEPLLQRIMDIAEQDEYLRQNYNLPQSGPAVQESAPASPSRYVEDNGFNLQVEQTWTYDQMDDLCGSGSQGQEQEQEHKKFTTISQDFAEESENSTKGFRQSEESPIASPQSPEEGEEDEEEVEQEVPNEEENRPLKPVTIGHKQKIDKRVKKSSSQRRIMVDPKHLTPTLNFLKEKIRKKQGVQKVDGCPSLHGAIYRITDPHGMAREWGERTRGSGYCGSPVAGKKKYREKPLTWTNFR